MSKLLESTNAEYHADREYLTSSGLKLLLDNPAQFYNDYVLNLKTEQSKPAFDEGTLVHALILEPEKVANHVVWNGLRKAGKEFEAFKAANPGKTILSMPQVLRCEELVKAYRQLPTAVNLIEQADFSEYTITGKIMEIKVKCRTDRYKLPQIQTYKFGGESEVGFNHIPGYIVDVKTTSMPSGKEMFEETVKQYKYELSAALYCLIAGIDDFYWLVLSKDDKQCHVYKASQATLQRGKELVFKALTVYKECMRTGVWEAQYPKQSFDTLQYEIEEI